MSQNISVPEPMYDRLKDRKKPLVARTFSAVYQSMLDEIETKPPDTVERWWVTDPVSVKTIKVDNDVYVALCILQRISADELSFRQLTQWLLDETEQDADDPSVDSDTDQDDRTTPLVVERPEPTP